MKRSDRRRIEDRIAVVTGAARGIGYSISRSLAKEGATVILTDASNEVKEAADDLRKSGLEATAMRMDVTDSNEVDHTIDGVIQQFGRVDILVNNAGIYPDEPALLDMSEEFWDRIFNINMKGVFRCTRAALRSMIRNRSGKIINISSVTGPRVSIPHCNAYSASKGAVSGFTRALALEVAQFGINVNAICPGVIRTPGMLSLYSEDKENRVARSIPLGKLGSPDDVADLVVFLASDESRYITGTEVIIDGGNIIQELKSTV
jgi:NAD(P)-dependent dehydrogenase (short-subunit alcohol dehydrogenase family)